MQEYPRVVSIAYRITRDPHLAEDVAQDVFARFARSKTPRDPRARAWLHVAAAHGALNALRTSRRRTERESRTAQMQQALRSESAGDPAAAVERHFDRAAVRRALLRIPGKDARILALRYGGLSYREIATALEIDLSQIGVRLSRAQHMFRRELERERF